MFYYFSHDYQLVFGTEISIPMTKAQRMLYGESAMTHAMVLTGVNVDVSFAYNIMWKFILKR
jgi:bleomycin hydrolase